MSVNNRKIIYPVRKDASSFGSGKKYIARGFKAPFKLSNGVYLTAALAAFCFVWGCEKYSWTKTGEKDLASKIDLGPTIGSLTEVSFTESIPVEGYGLVGGLNGTGSSECPPQLRAYLTRYIPTQVSGEKIEVDKLINSANTAIVHVEGTMPTTGLKNQVFDLKVTTLAGSQTISLQGGWLYNTELTVTRQFAITSRTLATARGAVFIDSIDTPKTDKRTGYILGGGTVLDEYKITVTLLSNDYLMASRIRNRLNERYSDAKAIAVSPGRIDLSVPGKYKAQKQKFVSIVKATYLSQTPEMIEERIKTFVRELAVSEDKQASETALEAIGRQSASKLATLLNSSNEEVRLRAGRCMLNLGDDRGLGVLAELAVNKSSAYRIEAMEAITTGAKRTDAAKILRQFLRDSDFKIRLAAYEQLRKLDDVTVTRKRIGREFYLDQVSNTEYKEIFVSRSGEPRIVLFGAPIYFRNNILVKSADGKIMIVSRRGERFVQVMRRHPTQPVMIGPLRSSFIVCDIIQVLCEEPPEQEGQSSGGLGVSYADMIALLKQMCDKGAIRAEFRAGPLPKID